MAANIKLSNEAANAKCQAIADLLAGGTLKIFTTPTPADADAAETATVLAEFTLPSPAFGTPGLGVMTANTINDTTGIVTGTATHWRAYSSGSPGTVVLQGDSATSGTSMIMNSTAINEGGPVSIISWVYTQPKA
jgi:hypothetical protein